MLTRWLLAVVGTAVLLAGVVSPLSATAHQVEVTAGVGDTTIRISGWTAPFAFVTFMESSAVVGTTTADASGRYMLLLVGQAPGIHAFRVFSRDAQGRTTKAVVTQLSATEHHETVISIFLPPAVSTSEQDGSVIIEGSTVPHATVVLTIDNRHFTVKADGGGNWRYTFVADDLPASEYYISVAAILPGGLQSYVAAIPPVKISARPHSVSQQAVGPGIFWAETLVPPGGERTDQAATGKEAQTRNPETGTPPNEKKASKSADKTRSSLLFALLWLLLSAVLWWFLLARRRARKDKVE